MYFILKSLLRLRLQLCSTTYSSLLGCGFQLGGTSFLNNLRNNSIVCGRKNKNYIIKISLTGLQLKKSIKIMYRYIKRRSTFYFVHSHFGFKLLMNQLYNKTNMLYLTFTRFVKSKFNESKICNFFFGNLKKLYFVSKWKPGLITNRTNFLETRKLRKLPVRFPKYGFVNDYNNNIVSVKEFKISRVPFSSLINLSASNTFFGFFDIPGNGLSYDTFFLTSNRPFILRFLLCCKTRVQNFPTCNMSNSPHFPGFSQNG